MGEKRKKMKRKPVISSEKKELGGEEEEHGEENGGNENGSEGVGRQGKWSPGDWRRRKRKRGCWKAREMEPRRLEAGKNVGANWVPVGAVCRALAELLAEVMRGHAGACTTG